MACLRCAVELLLCLKRAYIKVDILSAGNCMAMSGTSGEEAGHTGGSPTRGKVEISTLVASSNSRFGA